MKLELRGSLVIFTLVVCSAVAVAQQSPQQLDRQFQKAAADYDAGHLQDAAAALEKLLPLTPNSFDVHELLGLVYAAQSQDTKAEEHLEIAVGIKPDSAAARTNLATCLSHLGKTDLALKNFRKAFELEPDSFDTNRNLGEFYIQSQKLVEGIPYLEKARKIKPASYENGYDLGLAYFLTGRISEAKELVETLIKQQNTGELHELLAQIAEKQGEFLAAGSEFEIAAHMDASEENLFNWGGELLLHRAYPPAVEVFQSGAQRYPRSPRLMIGLGMAFYSLGRYEEAVKALLSAAELNPSDARCYYFLSKAYDSSPKLANQVNETFRRFAELQPENARAQYYYAMSLWKGKRAEDPSFDLHPVEMLLDKTTQLDPSFPEAHLQLGNLYSDRHDYAESTAQYQRAIELNPDLADAHYRLARNYSQAGQKDRAQHEVEVYQRLRQQHLADLDKQDLQVQQFVYTAKTEPSSQP